LRCGNRILGPSQNTRRRRHGRGFEMPMPIPASDPRARSSSRQAGPQHVQMPTDVQSLNSVFSSVVGSVATSVTQVAVQAGSVIVRSFEEMQVPPQPPAPMATPSAADTTAASGPLSAAGSPGTSVVPGHRARRPPALIDDSRVENRACIQNPRVLQVQRDSKLLGRSSPKKATRTNRRSSIFTVVEESVLEEAPVVAVFDLPDLQADRVRQSLCYPPPLQPFVVEGLQSDSRRCVLSLESAGMGQAHPSHPELGPSRTRATRQCSRAAVAHGATRTRRHPAPCATARNRDGGTHNKVELSFCVCAQELALPWTCQPGRL